MKEKIFVAENLNFLSFLLALFLKIFGYGSYYLKLDFVTKNIFGPNLLRKVNIKRIEIKKKDKFIINHETDFYKVCQQYVERKVLNKKLYKDFSKLFGLEENFEKKIGIIIHEQFQNTHSNHSSFSVLLIFLNQNKKQCSYIVKISNSSIKKKLLKLYFPKTIIIRSYLENLLKYLFKVPFSLSKMFSGLIKTYARKSPLINKICDQKVIFFPHQSIFYGDIFIKNYFYNKSSNSPLNIKNIIHAEYDNSIVNDKKILNHYDKLNIKNFFLKKPNAAFVIKKLFIYLCFLFENRKKIINKSDFFNLVVLFYVYTKFTNYKKELEKFPKVTLAIVGNDILFDKVLCLALTSKKIMILATMDRSITADTNACNLIADHYFVPSKYFEKSIRKKKFSLVNNYYHTGIIRKNFFLNSSFANENKKFRKKFKKMILVLDYKTTPSGNLKILTDIDNNLIFYKDIIEVSKKFPSYLFIIRSKDLSLNIEQLKEIKNKLTKQENIILDKKRNFNRSFHLGRDCDLSIIRACSFVDDMLAIKKNVIIYDKFISATNYNVLRYRYLKLPIFSDNMSNLEQKIKFYIRNKNYLFTGKYGARVSKLFNHKINLDQKINKIMNKIIH